MSVAAMVGGVPVSVADVDAREKRLRDSRIASSLPRPGTSEGRQLRRWLTQLLVTERVVAVEAASRGLDADGAPTEQELLPDTTSRLEIGSITAAALGHPLGRALFDDVTSTVDVTGDDVASYQARNPHRFASAAEVAGASARSGAAPRIPAVARRTAGCAGRTCPRVRASWRSAPARQHP